jgi:hypothetical protein
MTMENDFETESENEELSFGLEDEETTEEEDEWAIR